MNRLKFYRISLWIALLSAVAALGIYGYWYMKTQVPDQIRVSEDENQTLYLGVKEVSVRVVKRQRVIPGGIPVGLYLETQGVYICRGSISRIEDKSRTVTDIELMGLSKVPGVKIHDLFE